jgi:transposase
MPQKKRIVGLDVAKTKVDACLRCDGQRFSAPSTPEGEAKMILWVQANRIERAVMEASGGYERSWSELLRTAGVEVVIVDPKRIRHFAKAAGRLAKNDRIDAEVIAWFAETFPVANAQPHDREREEVDRLLQARTTLKDLDEQIKQQGEHQPPPLVVKALRAIAKVTRAELRTLDAAIAAKIKANRGFAHRAEIIRSFPGLGDQTVAGVIPGCPSSDTSATRPPRRSSGLRLTTTAATAKASAPSRAGDASFATSSICRSWAPPPSTTRCSRPPIGASSPRASRAKSPSSPACASSSSYSTPCLRAIRPGTRRHAPSHERVAKPTVGASRRSLAGQKDRWADGVKVEAAAGGGAKRQP